VVLLFGLLLFLLFVLFVVVCILLLFVLLLFVLCCYLCCSVVNCVVCCCLYFVAICVVIICVVLLLIVLFYVFFMCKCVLPPGVNPIAVNKCINIISNISESIFLNSSQFYLFSSSVTQFLRVTLRHKLRYESEFYVMEHMLVLQGTVVEMRSKI
jgi:hypothetical protein